MFWRRTANPDTKSQEIKAAKPEIEEEKKNDAKEAASEKAGPEEVEQAKQEEKEIKVIMASPAPPPSASLPTPKLSFKQARSLEKRLADSAVILSKYPTRLPIVVEKHEKATTDVPPLDKIKYLTPKNMPFAEFVYVIRKRLKLKDGQALIIFCGNSLPRQDITVGELYQQHKDKDGFLYMQYMGEAAFGTK